MKVKHLLIGAPILFWLFLIIRMLYLEFTTNEKWFFAERETNCIFDGLTIIFGSLGIIALAVVIALILMALLEKNKDKLIRMLNKKIL